MLKKVSIRKSYEFLLQNQRFKNYFITTPIYYTNDKPHIGHFYTNCLADVLARWNRLKGNKVVFSTGTDDHGLKIQRTANNLKISPQKLVNNSSNNFKSLFTAANFAFTDFIRTSEDRHKSTVLKAWTDMASKGFLSRQTYSGWYSATEECFLADNTTKKSPFVSDSLEWCEETNWVFNITPFKSRIRDWIDSGVIHPPSIMPIVNGFLNDTNLVSLSRPTSRVSWGVPVPGDDSQTVYVWFDALLNYLTVAEGQRGSWPPDVQVIGKDIVRFHCVLWPAMLLALGLELPKMLLVHSHWLYAGTKMSKSVGNVLDPHDEAASLGGYEALRYSLLCEDAVSTDSSYSRERAVARVNSDLVNIAGNLLSRITSRRLNPEQTFGLEGPIDERVFSGSIYPSLAASLNDLPTVFDLHLAAARPHLALAALIAVLRLTNIFLDHEHPWRPSVPKETRSAVLHVCAESLRVSAILLQAVTPLLADRALSRLAIAPGDRSFASATFRNCGGPPRDVAHAEDAFVLLKRVKE